jgi:hypothetical protein
VTNSPIEDVLNLVVLPLGVALAVKDSVPDWIARGREQFETARSVGELVTDYGHRKVAKTLVGLGILAGPPPPHPAAKAEPPAPAAPSTNGRSAASPVAMAIDVDPGELAIPGYDSLSASQVVARLPGLAPPELAAVQSYEAATRGRRTILTRISQLQTGWS